MKPELFHHLLARFLTLDSRTEPYLKTEQVIKNLKALHQIPDLATLSLASTEAFYYWPLTICYCCGTIWKDWKNSNLLTPVCENCYIVGKTYPCNFQHSTGWLSRELTQLPTVHKQALVGALNHGKYLRTYYGTSYNDGRLTAPSRGGLERAEFQDSVESVQEKDIIQSGNGGPIRTENSEDKLRTNGVREAGSLAAIRKAKILRDINRRLSQKSEE